MIWIHYWSLLNWQNLRLRCGCIAFPVNLFLTLFHHFLLNLKMLYMYIVWSQVRRRVTRRLTRLHTLWNVLKYRKILWNGVLRLRCGCVYFFNLLKTSTVALLYLHHLTQNARRNFLSLRMTVGHVTCTDVFPNEVLSRHRLRFILN